MSGNPRGSQRARRRGAQQGLTLVLALVLLTVMALGAAASARVARASLSIAGDARAQLLARLAAENALHWCEQQVLQRSEALPLTAPDAGDSPAEPMRWSRLGSWSGPGSIATTLPGFLSSDRRQPAPQCLAEKAVLPSPDAASGDATESAAPGSGAIAPGAANPSTERLVVVLTARGFSVDDLRASGNAGSGAQVWLQAQIVAAVPPGESSAAAADLSSADTSNPPAWQLLHRAWRQLVNPPL